MVNRLAQHPMVLSTAIQLANSIAANAPLSVAESLTLARAVQDESEAELRRRSVAATERIRLTDDAQEGPLAFLEKRQPRWRGR